MVENSMVADLNHSETLLPIIYSRKGFIFKIEK